MMRWNSILPALMIGTIAINIPIFQVVAQTLSQPDVAKLARQFVVRIDGRGVGGTGFIISKNGNRYKVLTNKHVVKSSNAYSVTTISKDNQTQVHTAQNIRLFPDVDLAEIEFTSDRDYAVAPFSTDRVYKEGSKVYAYGWATTSQSMTERSSQILSGSFGSSLSQAPEGYTLTMNGFNPVPGMSGSPLLNEEGKVVGIYGHYGVDRQNDVKFLTLPFGIPIATYQLYASTPFVRPKVPSPSPPIVTTNPSQPANINFSQSYLLAEKNISGFITPISPDGRVFLSESLATIQVRRLADGQFIRSLNGHENLISAAISSDGATLISGYYNSLLKMWRLSDGQLLNTFIGYKDDTFDEVAISPDGQTIVGGSRQGFIHVWKLSSKQGSYSIIAHKDSVRSLRISPDGQTLVSGSQDKTIRVWRLSDGKQLSVLEEHKGSVFSVAISPDGQKIVSGSDDRTVKIWRLSDGKLLRTLKGHEKWVTCVTISADGQLILSGGGDTTIKVWRLSDGKLLNTLKGHQDSVRSVAIAPDGGTIVSGSKDGTVRVWKLSP